MAQKPTTERKKTVKQQNAAPSRIEDGMDYKSLVGRIVKIDDNAKYFVGGNGIPSWVREQELYISNISERGAVTIALSDSLENIDVIMKQNLILTDEYRKPFDSDVELDNISVRIFGVPSRMDCIRENQRRLKVPDELIFIDENREGCVPTARRAWSYPTDKEFVLVLQDDVELCDDFASVCKRIVKTHPNKIISLFQIHCMSRVAIRGNMKDMRSPYVSMRADRISGQGIIMRTEWVKPCLESWEPEKIKGDDVNIGLWAKANGITALTTIPSTIQHLGQISVFDKSRSIGMTEFYKKSAAKADWENSYVTASTNLIR